MPVAEPERRRNNNNRRETLLRAWCSLSAIVIARANAGMTAVRTAVASVDGTPFTPIFARIAVRALLQ